MIPLAWLARVTMKQKRAHDILEALTRIFYWSARQRCYKCEVRLRMDVLTSSFITVTQSKKREEKEEVSWGVDSSTGWLLSPECALCVNSAYINLDHHIIACNSIEGGNSSFGGPGPVIIAARLRLPTSMLPSRRGFFCWCCIIVFCQGRKTSFLALFLLISLSLSFSLLSLPPCSGLLISLSLASICLFRSVQLR